MTEQIKEKDEQNPCVDGLVVHFIVVVARQFYTCDKWHLDHSKVKSPFLHSYQ